MGSLYAYLVIRAIFSREQTARHGGGVAPTLFLLTPVSDDTDNPDTVMIARERGDQGQRRGVLAELHEPETVVLAIGPPEIVQPSWRRQEWFIYGFLAIRMTKTRK